MSPLARLHFAVTWALAGLIWTVQITHYPLFALVGPDSFPAYEAAHTASIVWVVGPLMLVELASGVALFLRGQRSPAFLCSLALLAVIWIVTALVHVPLHRELAGGFDTSAHEALVYANWVRTFAWSARGLILATLRPAI